MIKSFFNNTPGLEFYCESELFDVIPHPTPAMKKIPDWFKKINPHTQDRGQNKQPGMTAKKCLPMLDAMSTGYIISTCADITVISNHDLSQIECVSGTHGQAHIPVVEKHSYQQVASKSWPIFKQDPLKFINHWFIKTNPGWSCFFQSPANHLNPHFTCLSGVVDTDLYKAKINFPAIWFTPNFDGVIPANTPLVQIIPFKRESLKEDVVVRKMNDKEKHEFNKVEKIQNLRNHYYTHEVREKRNGD